MVLKHGNESNFYVQVSVFVVERLEFRNL